MFKKLNCVALAVASAAAFFTGPTQAFDLTGKGFVQYGDGQSYSLPVLQIQDGCTGPGCAYYVNSTPGAIKGLTVLGTGSGGTDVLENFVGMDNAYATPNSSGITFWRPSATTFTGTQIAGGVYNGENTWDTTLLALKNYLTTGSVIEQMIFFFNNNQEKSGGTYNQSLAAWAQITVRNAARDIIGVYDFTNMGGAYRTVGEGGGGNLLGNVATYTSPGQSAVPKATTNPAPGTRSSTDYVLSGGQLCLEIATGNLLDCNSVTKQQLQQKEVIAIDHNLGANEAAYAILFPELNAQLLNLFGTTSDSDLAAYTMSVDIRLGCDPALDPAGAICAPQDALYGYGRNLNNGYEQIFISKASDVVNVPEPSSLLLAGLALAGLAGLRRRR